MNKLFLFMLLFLAGTVAAQEYVYVNTSNLLLRDRPEKEYNVFDVLQAPCRLKVIPYSTGYETKAIKDRFYHVLLSVWFEETKRSYSSYGWVEKKYVVKSLGQITVRDIDTSQIIAYTATPVSGELPPSPNYRNYPYPKYKGGEKTFDSENKKGKYRKGPRGGCYYVNAKGRKVYVDAKLCK